jgi:ABC-type Fe3+ transport system permease subunit
MNRNFDFYEYAGIIIPGTVLVMALVWLFPEGRALFSKDGVTLGELGLFVIIAYAAGQLVQAIGNGLEWV